MSQSPKQSDQRMWTMGPEDCNNKEHNKPSEEKASTMTHQPNAKLAAFDTIDSDTE